ncbi:MAG: hypothetical protein E6767_12755 [Dysgonomonas sp.]|nr:hypothetical protein [Dysgonomonas sp.]
MSCTNSKYKTPDHLTISWDNSLMLPPCKGMENNVGLAGVFSGFVNNKLIITGGANFPVGYPWTGGKKTWWNTLYSFDTLSGVWNVYNDFLDKPLAYGASVQMEDGVLCIGGCDAESCFSDVFLIKEVDGSLMIVKDKYPVLPIPLANMSVALLDNKIYIAGGQESAIKEKATKHFLVLDLNDITRGWIILPEWPGEARGYAVAIAQAGKIFLFSGRNYGPDEEMVMLTDGYSFDYKNNKWEKLNGEFPVMAGTAIAEGDDNIIFVGGVDKILPTAPDHCGFSNNLSIYNVKTNNLEPLTICPYSIPVTTKLVATKNGFYISSGEIKPGIRTPHILKGIIKRSP